MTPLRSYVGSRGRDIMQQWLQILVNKWIATIIMINYNNNMILLFTRAVRQRVVEDRLARVASCSATLECGRRTVSAVSERATFWGAAARWRARPIGNTCAAASSAADWSGVKTRARGSGRTDDCNITTGRCSGMIAATVMLRYYNTCTRWDGVNFFFWFFFYLGTRVNGTGERRVVSRRVPGVRVYLYHGWARCARVWAMRQ